MRSTLCRKFPAAGLWFAVASLTLGAGAAPPPQEEALKKLSGEFPGLVKAADADSDGALNLAEFRGFESAVRRAGGAILNGLDPTLAQKKEAKDLKKYDKNVDGRLDDEEKKAMAEALRLKEIKDFDWNVDGKLSEREETAQKWAAEGRSDGAFRKLDANADSRLSTEELGASLAALGGIKVKKPQAP